MRVVNESSVVAPLYFWVGALNIGPAAARPAAPVPTALGCAYYNKNEKRFFKMNNSGEWVECMGVVSRRRVWLVGVGGIYGCG